MSFLSEIMTVKREEVSRAKRERSEASLLEEAKHTPRDFTSGLRRPELAVIAEVKRASPSKGPIAANVDLPALISAYEAGGAAAVSVLTDRTFFGGSLDDLKTVRSLTDLPLLRKDFLIDPYQLAEAAAHGADAVLLIAACLGRARMEAMLAAALDLNLTPLVEVHSKEELASVLAMSVSLIGINHRDLHTFRIDLGLSARLMPMMPQKTTVVAESGIRGWEDAEAMARIGTDAVLTGETLMRSKDPAAEIRLLRRPKPGC